MQLYWSYRGVKRQEATLRSSSNDHGWRLGKHRCRVVSHERPIGDAAQPVRGIHKKETAPDRGRRSCGWWRWREANFYNLAPHAHEYLRLLVALPPFLPLVTVAWVPSLRPEVRITAVRHRFDRPMRASWVSESTLGLDLRLSLACRRQIVKSIVDLGSRAIA